MPYGPVYDAQIDTYRPQSPVTVSLLKQGYGGSVSTMRLASDPIEEQASTSDSDETVPLRPRKGVLRLAADQEGVIEDVYADDTPWRIRIEVDGTLDLIGPVRKHLRTTSDDKLSTAPLELKWNDGLGLLQDVDFRQPEDGRLYQERRSIIGWIVEVLRKTGLGLDVAAASEWFTPSMSDPQNPLEQEWLGPERFVDDDGAPMTAFAVLEDLVQNKQAVLAQERGLWHVYQRSLFRFDTFDRWVYPSDWTDSDASPAAETYTAYVDVPDSFTARPTV